MSDNYGPPKTPPPPEAMAPFPSFHRKETHRALASVLVRAFSQSAHGNGVRRHSDGEPFERQLIVQGALRLGTGGPLFQAIKKIEESRRLAPSAAVHELLGAINYIAGAIVAIEISEGSASNQDSEAESYNRQLRDIVDRTPFAPQVFGGIADGAIKDGSAFEARADALTGAAEGVCQAPKEDSIKVGWGVGYPALPGCQTPDDCECARHVASIASIGGINGVLVVRAGDAGTQPAHQAASIDDIVRDLVSRGICVAEWPPEAKQAVFSSPNK